MGCQYELSVDLNYLFISYSNVLGFDQDMADKVGAYMENEGLKVLRRC